MRDCTLEKCSFLGKETTATTFYGCKIGGTNISDTNFEVVDLGDSIFESCALSSCTLHLKKAHQIYGKNQNFVIQNSRMMSVFFKKGCVNEAKILRSYLDNCNFWNAEAKNLDFLGSTMVDTVISCSDLSGSNFSETTITGCEIYESDLTSSRWGEAKVDMAYIRAVGDAYDQHSLYDAQVQLGLTEKQFEFLVLSGAIEVRDNMSKGKVSSNFNTKEHHVPAWVLENLSVVEQT
jgi:hypothetical protein